MKSEKSYPNWNKRLTDSSEIVAPTSRVYAQSLLCAVRERSKLDEFYRKDCVDSFGDKCQQFTSDVYLLFHQQNLSAMTQTELAKHLDAIQSPSPQLDTIRSKLTDEQLSMFIKSRYIQSPGELMRWSSYIEANAQSIIDSLPQDPTPTLDPTPTPDSSPAPVPAE